MKKILYVEDNLDTAEAVRIILTGVGYDVELAHTGMEGLEKLQKNDYDLVILDVMLPDMSGGDIFEKTVVTKKCKYVFLSITPVDKKGRVKLLKKGVSDYINKPFRKDDLIERISKVVGSGGK